MDFSSHVIAIKKLYQVLAGKDMDVILSYKGLGYGNTTPWELRIDSREVKSVSHEKAAADLYNILQEELSKKADNAEQEAKNLRNTLKQLRSN
jgi:hypothetical protein